MEHRYFRQQLTWVTVTVLLVITTALRLTEVISTPFFEVGITFFAFGGAIYFALVSQNRDVISKRIVVMFILLTAYNGLSAGSYQLLGYRLKMFSNLLMIALLSYMWFSTERKHNGIAELLAETPLEPLTELEDEEDKK